jgi:hypothetical protein
MMSGLSDAQNIIEAVCIVEAKARLFHPDLVGKGIFSALTVWHYRGHYDDKSQCVHCKELDNRDFLGNEIRARFPDLEVIDEYTIYVNLHMTLWGADNCRCYLWREEEPAGQIQTYNDATLFGDEE